MCKILWMPKGTKYVIVNIITWIKIKINKEKKRKFVSVTNRSSSFLTVLVLWFKYYSSRYQNFNIHLDKVIWV